jgi:guanylate kinase
VTSAPSSSTTRGRLLVLAGPSGVGKSTVVAELRRMDAPLWFSVSATTRAARPGEVDGREYHFVTDEEFDRMVEAGEMLEWASIHRGLHRSGTPARPVEEHLAAGPARCAGAGPTRCWCSCSPRRGRSWCRG